jgi:hypothetical protein
MNHPLPKELTNAPASAPIYYLSVLLEKTLERIFYHSVTIALVLAKKWAALRGKNRPIDKVYENTERYN